jgi:hypothetical protein
MKSVFHAEERWIMFFQNIRKHLPHYTILLALRKTVISN